MLREVFSLFASFQIVQGTSVWDVSGKFPLCLEPHLISWPEKAEKM